jgi:gliding motility-associated protein GldM
MAGGKETPRQRMIGILYLVLLGLIALSVNDSLLDAFKNITDSLSTSTTNVNSGVDATFSSFEATKLKDDPIKAKPIYDRAKKASGYARDLESYINELKTALAKQGGGINESSGDLEGRASVDISPRFMINGGKATELRKKVNETREKLLSLLDAKERITVKFSLSTIDPQRKGGVSKTWEEANFGDGIPLAAAMTALTKIQADAKNAESEMVKKILGKMDQAEINLDQFAAVAVAPTSYVIQGQPYTAEVFLTASSSTLKQTINVGGANLPIREGKGVYTVNTNREGMFSWVGSLTVIGTDGKPKTYRTPEQKYQVARPSAVVSPDKMNVFYIGVPNPVSISAPGIPKEKLRVSVSSGSMSGANGRYTFTSNTPTPVIVNVSAEVNGKVQAIGSSNFRVKRIPDPVVRFAGKDRGTLSAAAIRAQNFVAAVLEGFDFDAKFTIVRYTLLVAKPRADVIVVQGNGNSLEGSAKAAINTVTPGTRIIFDNVVAVGPDGSQRGLGSIVLTAN